MSEMEMAMGEGPSRRRNQKERREGQAFADSYQKVDSPGLRTRPG